MYGHLEEHINIFVSKICVNRVTKKVISKTFSALYLQPILVTSPIKGSLISTILQKRRNNIKKFCLTHIGIAMYNKEFHDIARIPFSFFEANSKQN